MSSNDEEDGAETMDFDEEFEHLGSIDFIDSAEEEEEEFELAIDEDNLVPEDEDNSEASSSVEDKKANSSPKRISMSTLSLQERRELLKKRQLKARMKSGGQGGSLDEDPLRSSSPNVEIFPYIEPFTKLFVALAYVDDNPSEPTKLNQNSEGDSQSVMRFQARNLAWKYHMQWVRRSAIVPSHLQTSKIAWEYTLLSDDCMRPVGNVIGILANTSSDVLSYLEKEPLSKCGAFINADSGVDGWQVFEMDRVESGDSLEDEFIDEDDQIERGVGDGRGSLCYDLRKPYLHIAMSESGYSEKSMQSCITYHSDAPILSLYEEDNSQKDGGFGRVATFGKLHPIGSKDSKGAKPVGRLLLFNAKSNKDAKQYVMDDPLMKKSVSFGL